MREYGEAGLDRGSRRRQRAFLLTILALLTLGFLAASSALAAPPADFQTSLVVGDGLSGPSGFEIAPDGRIFIS